MALFRQSPAWALAASLVGFSCGGDGGGGPGPAPNTLAVHAGDNQVGPAGAQLTAPLAVRVTDPSGQPVANLPISWAVVHNVTFATVAGAPSNIGNMGSGSSSRQFGTPGTFDDECTLHAGMTGSATVVP